MIFVWLACGVFISQFGVYFEILRGVFRARENVCFIGFCVVPGRYNDLHTAKNFFGGHSEAPPFLMCINLDDFDSGYLGLAKSIRNENMVTKTRSRRAGYDTKFK